MRKDLTRNLCNFQKIFLTNKKDDPQHNKMAPAQIINSTKISWIKKLLQTPIDDYRKFAVWCILPPYLINFRK